jgi:glycerophosphoryl diester phosphodiesterase
MHDAGIRVFPYNVDTFGDYSRMRDLKVDGVITGDPSLSGERTRLKKAA